MRSRMLTELDSADKKGAHMEHLLRNVKMSCCARFRFSPSAKHEL